MSNPFQDATTLADPETATQTQRVEPVNTDRNPFESAQSLADPDPTMPAHKVQGAGTPENPLQAIVTFSEKIQEARQVGQLQFRESAMGHAVATGRLTLEEAEKQIADDDRMAQLSGDIENYEKQAWNSWITGIPTSIALSTAKQLPMLEEALKVSTLAGGAAGLGTAATGVGASVAVPVGAAAGTTAAAGWAADYITGQEYLERRRKGIPHDEALRDSTVSGIIQGSLQGLRFGQAAKVPLTTAKNVLTAHATSIARFLSEGVKFGGSQLGLAEAQTATKLITDAIAGTVSKKPDAVPTLEQAVQEFNATFQETLKGSIGLYLGGKVAGSGAGLTAKSLLAGLRKTHDVHLQKQAVKLEKIRAKEEAATQTEITTNPAEVQGPSQAAQKRKIQAAQRLEKRVAAEKEVNRIFDAAASRFTIDTAESRIQEVNRIQRLLKRMVTNSDKLDDAMKTRLLSRVVEIDGVKDLLREGQRFIEDQRGREHANDMAAAQKRLQGAIQSGQVKGKKAALPAAAQKSLQWYKEFFTEPESTNSGRKSEPGAGLANEPRKKGEPRRNEPVVKGEPGAKELNDPTADQLAEQSETRQRALQKAIDFVDRGIEEEKNRLNEQVEKLEQNELSEIFNQPAGLVEKQRIAMLASQYWSNALDVEGINKLAEQIEGIVETGKSEFLERKQQEVQQRLNDRQNIFDAVNGIKPVVPSQSKSAPKQLTGLGKIVNSLRRNSTSLWDKLLQDTPSEKRQALINRVLDFTGVENRESAININAAEKMTQLFTDAAGSMREANRLIKDGTKSELFEVGYTDLNGEPQQLGRHTLNELVYLHMALDDEGAIPGLVHGNKYTLKGMVESGETSTQEAVRRILQTREGGKYLQLADSIKDFYRWFAPTVANHYLKEYGVELPMSQDYSGQIFHRQIERLRSAGDLMEDVHQFAKQTLDPGSIKVRKNSKLPIRLVDPFVQVQRHRSNMAFWVANSEKARNLSFIFSDTTKDGLRDVIQHKFGREFTGLIDGRLAWQFHLKPGIMDIADKSWQAVKNNMATGLLGARLDQAPKQWTSILSALSTNTFSEFADGLKSAANPEQLKEYVSRSELYADRQNELLPQILEATQERTYLDAVSGDKLMPAKQFFLIPMSKWGDGVASAITGFIEFNRVRKAGGSIEEAVLAGDSLVDRTQSSSRASQKVPAEFKGGIGNLSLAFAKQNLQLQNIESGALRDWFIHKDAKHFQRLVRTIAGIHTGQALFQAINSFPAWVIGDEEDRHDAELRVASAFLGGSYSQLPLLGFDVVAGALSGFQGDQEPRTIIGGLAAESAKLLKRWGKIGIKLAQNKDVEGEEWAKAFKSLAGVASTSVGLPFFGLFNTIDYSSKLVKKVQGEE